MIETRIDQAIADLEAAGPAPAESLAFLDDRAITDDEAALLRTQLQACIDSVPADADGNAFVAGIDTNLNVVASSRTAQTQLDQLQRCTDDTVGDLPALYQLLRSATGPTNGG